MRLMNLHQDAPRLRASLCYWRLGPWSSALAQTEPFVIQDIRVEGLQRISPGSVFAALPVGVGDTSILRVRAAAKSLFASGNFDDISIARDGGVLVVVVAERPSISEITIDGNKAIETEALLDGLKGAGLSVGQVFQRSTLEGMQLELQRQYVLQGRYDATIDSEVIAEPRNRVSIAIEVNEGTVATIQHINVVGNSMLSDDDLIDLFELKTEGWFSFFTSDNKYSKEKLTSDLRNSPLITSIEAICYSVLIRRRWRCHRIRKRSTSPLTSLKGQSSPSAKWA